VTQLEKVLERGCPSISPPSNHIFKDILVNKNLFV